MKKLKKISLASLSKEKLEKREQNCILGGDDCCACPCASYDAITLSGTGLRDGWALGYGVGKFG